MTTPRLDWTCEQAMAAQETALAADPARSISDPTLPLYQWTALHAMERERARFEAGDRMAVLAAIRQCANHDLPLPAWAATAYITAYDRVLRCETASFDDAFGRPYPKGAHMHALRKQRALRLRVWNAVRRIRQSDPATPINAILFERVGEAMRPPIGKTLAETYYYEAKRLLDAGP